MKAVKAFVKTCYSEALLPTTSSVAENEREDGSLISEEKDGTPPRETTYHGGLGLRFKFPGDPKKCVQISFMTETCRPVTSQTAGSVEDQVMDNLPPK